ncbi:MAG: type II toxin-antitoxin system HicB family antitoxin [Candidatus Rokuibacteriota bacterium]
MKYYTFEIVIEKEPQDDGYAAYSPTLPGCFSNGRTIEEAKRNMREAMRQHIESLQAHGQPIPQNDRLVHVEELTVGVP